MRIFVVSHKPIEIPSTDILFPIRSDRRDGINIADKEAYCELRAQYWVWKNMMLDRKEYVGFFHFRRYLDIARSFIYVPSSQQRPLPYYIKKEPNVHDYTSEKIQAANEFDIIAPVWEYTGENIWKRYAKSKGHRKEDLQLVYKIIKQKYPDFISAANSYLEGEGEYFGNIYIMRWDLFEKYCEWLFGILEEFDSKVCEKLKYTNGYLGERLFGIYFTWLQSQNGIICGECPRILFSCYDDHEHHFFQKKLLNIILPPGTKRRKYMKKIVKTGTENL